MRPFLLNLTLFVFVQLAVAAGILSAYRIDPTAYYLIMARKEQRIKDLPSPRVIVIGGSTGPFSCDADALAAATGRPTTILAHHVTLGMTFILNQATAMMHDNTGKQPDLYLFSLEYSLLGKHRNTDPSAMTELLAYHQSGLLRIGVEGGKQFMDSAHILCGRILRRSLRLHLRGTKRELSPSRGPYYRLESFAPEGNIRPELLLADHTKANQDLPIGADSRSIQQASQALKRFAETIRGNGNELVIVLPALPDHVYKQNEAKLNPILDALQDSGIPILNDRSSIPSDPNTFLDTVYHRNRAGMELQTQRVITGLRAAVASGAIAPLPGLMAP